MNCSLEPCGPLLIEFRCLRTPPNKASSFQTDVPPLINLGASKINHFEADFLPLPAWILHPERSTTHTSVGPCWHNTCLEKGFSIKVTESGIGLALPSHR